MNHNTNLKKLGLSIALTLSLTAFTGLMSLPAQAAIEVGIPGASVYVGGQSSYYNGYGYRHGYYRNGGYHGAAYRGGSVYHNGGVYRHGTVYHNGNVHRYHHYR